MILEIGPQKYRVSKMLCLYSPIQMWETLLSILVFRCEVCPGLLRVREQKAEKDISPCGLMKQRASHWISYH